MCSRTTFLSTSVLLTIVIAFGITRYYCFRYTVKCCLVTRYILLFSINGIICCSVTLCIAWCSITQWYSVRLHVDFVFNNTWKWNVIFIIDWGKCLTMHFEAVFLWTLINHIDLNILIENNSCLTCVSLFSDIVCLLCVCVCAGLSMTPVVFGCT